MVTDKKEALEGLKSGKLSLADIAMELRNDQEIALEYIRQYGESAITFLTATNSLPTNREFIEKLKVMFKELDIETIQRKFNISVEDKEVLADDLEVDIMKLFVEDPKEIPEEELEVDIMELFGKDSKELVDDLEVDIMEIVDEQAKVSEDSRIKILEGEYDIYMKNMQVLTNLTRNNNGLRNKLKQFEHNGERNR